MRCVIPGESLVFLLEWFSKSFVCFSFLTNTHYSLEFGRECYCGNEINPESGAVQQECPLQGLMACAGNTKQLCGAPNLMIYYYSETL